MNTHILYRWWQEHRESDRSNQLHQELTVLLQDRSDTAQRLVNLQKTKHPGQLESWYLDKVVYDLRREA